MIELGKHIEILLLNYECVIVPGFGGFMAHHVNARYDETENLFLPPFRTLGFNPQLKLNDSLLAQSYVEAYDISYPEAVDRIQEEVNELKQHIQNFGSFELNDIGTITLNEDGNYEFEPCESGILTPWLYGLGGVEMKLYNELENNNKIYNSADVITLADKNEEAQNIQTVNTHHAQTEEKVIRIKISWIRNAVTLAAAVIAFLIITPSISNSYNTNANFGYTLRNFIPTNEIVNKKNVTDNFTKKTSATVRIDDSKSTLYADNNDIKLITSRGDSVKNHKSIDKYYCIVLASRITKKNAELYIEELCKNGLRDVSIYIKNGIVRVIYGEYTNEAEAYDTLRGIRNNKYFEQAWVYKKQ